jgi:hypothetical protein
MIQQDKILYHIGYINLSGKVYINETRQDTVSHGYLNLSYLVLYHLWYALPDRFR